MAMISCFTRILRAFSVWGLAGFLAACGSWPLGPGGWEAPGKEIAIAVTQSHRLVSFRAGEPARLLTDVRLQGLQAGESILGLDFRVKNETLYALGSSGRLYRVDIESGRLTAVGAPIPVALVGEIGFDFNPTVDRIRVVNDRGLNLRLHPDTGAVVDSNPNVDGLQLDGSLAFDAADVNQGRALRVVGAAYTYNKADPKITTNFAIDARQGLLLTQGSREGTTPAVSPNTGRLFTVGPLRAGAFDTAGFDIDVITDLAFAALTSHGAQASRWVQIDLATGRARELGIIGGGEAVRAIALEPQ